MVAILALAALSAQAYRLTFKDTTGVVRSYQIVADMKGSMEMLGSTVPVTSTTKMLAVEKVLAVRNGISSLSFELKDGTTKMGIGALPGDAEGQNIEQPLPGFTINYDRTPQGKVSNLKTSGELASRFGGMFDTLNNSSQYPGQGLEFPNKELAAGDTWVGKQTVEFFPGSQIHVTAKYTLVGTRVVQGKTYLELKCDMTGTMPAAAIKMPTLGGDDAAAAPTTTMGMTLSGQSTSLFDEAAGEIYGTTYTMKVKIDMTTPGDNGAGIMNMMLTGKMLKAN
jgi:hypothetical protein